MNSEWESGFRHDAVALTLVHFRYVDQNNFLRSVKNVKVDDTQTHSDANLLRVPPCKSIEFHMSIDGNTMYWRFHEKPNLRRRQFAVSGIHAYVALLTDAIYNKPFGFSQLQNRRASRLGLGMGDARFRYWVMQNRYCDRFFNKKTAVYEEAARNDLLPGGNEVKVESRGFGILNMLDGSTFVNGQKIPTVKLPVMLLHPDMTYVGPNLYTRRRPKYLDLDSTQVLHVKALGAKVCIAFGVYIIKNTLEIPTGSRMVSQASAQIMGTAPQFEHASKPRSVVMVEFRGEDMLFTFSGPTAGVVIVEWYTRESSQDSVYSDIVDGGAIGSKLQRNYCPQADRRCEQELHRGIHAPAPDDSVIHKRGGIVDLDGRSRLGYCFAGSNRLLCRPESPGRVSASDMAQFSNANNILMAIIPSESPYF
ncbi:glycoside hydrolase family 55 protein [Exserohilum turcica Et28A]|uniref:Glycoside hydrolase family 55 protein n=1 Tax=Exserohilum turcicum (strain 28A) TaxID=671987 RepID=R0IQL3_EXST2|nr:glycoside hydrolase family 55 protein [Exserohilum turcica Et28A]EOA87185.1 glycoside hydrolase family 55 protein [Exserohilum turcica Et28A]